MSEAGMTHKALEYWISGIKCDAKGCDFRDESVALENYPEWLDRPCPKCGGNLLTQTDFDTVNLLVKAANAVNEIIGPIDGEKVKAGIPIKIEFDGSGVSNVSFRRADESTA